LAIRLVILLVPLGIALGLAVAQFRREAAEKSADPYSGAGAIEFDFASDRVTAGRPAG
jgi:hypothetical protein